MLPLNRLGLVDMKALSVINSDQGELGEDFGAFNILGHRLDTQNTCNFDETANRSVVEGIFRNIANELPIDFKVIDGEPLQIAER